MKKISSVVAAFVVVLLMVSAGYAQSEDAAKWHAGGQKGRVFKELDLTPEQEKKLEANRTAQRQEMMKLQAAIKEQHARLREVLKSPNATKATVEPITREIKTLQAQLLEHRIDGIFAVKGILTAEQFAKFQQMTEKRTEKRKGHFQNWRRGRKGDKQHQHCEKPV